MQFGGVMLRFLFVLFLSLLPLRATATPEALSAAIAALGDRDYGLAALERARITDPSAADVVTWIRLRQGEGLMQEYVDFLDRNGDWPGLPYLIRMGERNIPEDAAPEAVLAYFDRQLPQTGWGSLR